MLKNKTLFLFLLIIITSAFFRVTNLNLIEFKADEAIALLLASRPVFGHPLPPFATASSVGILNPPLFTYLIFPTVSLTLDPRIISLYIGIINSLAIGFLFLIIKRYYGYKIAFIASILLAFSPWSIIFSRKIWTPDFILPFTIILIYSLHKIILEKKLKYWTLFGASALFLLQLHQSSIFFFLILSIFLWLQRIKINLKYLLRGIFIGILPLIPYLIYQIENGCLTCSALFSIGSKLSFQHALSVFMRPMQILGQGNFFFVLGNDALTFAQNFPLVYKLRPIFYSEYLLLPLGMFLFWKRFPTLRPFVYTTVALPLLYLLLKIEPFMHYFIILTPFLFLYLAVSLAFLISSKNNYIKIISLTLFISLIFSSIIFNHSFFNLLKSKKTLNGDYGNTLSANEEKLKEIRKKYKNSKQREEIVLLSLIPRNNFYGNSFLAKLLYSSSKTGRDLSLLEQKLIDEPHDILTQNELIAYYTTSIPNVETVKFLKDKTKKIPGYGPVDREVYFYYTSKNFLKLGFVTGLGIEFDIPYHWEVEEGDALNTITIYGDGFSIYMERITGFTQTTVSQAGNDSYTYQVGQAVVLSQKVEKVTCLYQKTYWCGSWYQPTLLGPFEYQIYYKRDDNNLIRANDQKLIGTIKTMDRIVYSIR